MNKKILHTLAILLTINLLATSLYIYLSNRSTFLNHPCPTQIFRTSDSPENHLKYKVYSYITNHVQNTVLNPLNEKVLEIILEQNSFSDQPSNQFTGYYTTINLTNHQISKYPLVWNHAPNDVSSGTLTWYFPGPLTLEKRF